jgi:hypothetical protein
MGSLPSPSLSHLAAPPEQSRGQSLDLSRMTADRRLAKLGKFAPIRRELGVAISLLGRAGMSEQPDFSIAAQQPAEGEAGGGGATAAFPYDRMTGRTVSVCLPGRPLA